jgi:hypothetical protein
MTGRFAGTHGLWALPANGGIFILTLRILVHAWL